MKNKGFTLIELLAVIIILGILMIIAIPSVTSYIYDSRKESYVDTAKEVISGARNMVNEGKLGMYDTDVTYYIDINCINTENSLKSPYGDFKKAYVVVTFDGQKYNYYWTSVDSAGIGTSRIVEVNKLDKETIESNLKESDILNTAGLDGRNKYVIIDKSNNCGKGTIEQVTDRVDSETGKNVVCKRATTLHTETCAAGACKYFGYSTGDTIRYGQLGTAGRLSTGDAFDCDVNYDGKFDGTNERFYYITSNGENAVLIYSKSITGNTTVAYNSSGSNENGPRTAMTYLPTTSTWKNPGLESLGTRSVKNDRGETSYNNHNYGTINYSGYAARILSMEDITGVCGNDIISYGGLSNCDFLFEKTIFDNPSSNTLNGSWIETASSYNNACGIHSGARIVDCGQNYGLVSTSSYYGVKPVIEVKKSKMGY